MLYFDSISYFYIITYFLHLKQCDNKFTNIPVSRLVSSIDINKLNYFVPNILFPATKYTLVWSTPISITSIHYQKTHTSHLII